MAESSGQEGEFVSHVTVYTSPIQAVRKTADDCRRLLALLDAFTVQYELVHVDTPDLRALVDQMSSGKALPLCFVGAQCLGSYDELSDLNEDGKFAMTLREAGYGAKLRGGESLPTTMPPPTVVKKVIKKVIVRRAKEGAGVGDTGAAEDDSAPPPLPEDDPPPPPPEDDPPPPPPEDDDPPPPPPEDDDPPPPPPPEDE
jgi:glutaredoxin